MLYKYKDSIIKNLSNELNLVRNNQKPTIYNKKIKYIFLHLLTFQTRILL